MQPSTTDAGAAGRQAAHDLGERLVGVRHAVQLHQRDRRADQPIHLVLGRARCSPSPARQGGPGKAASPAPPASPITPIGRLRSQSGAVPSPRHRRCAGSAPVPHRAWHRTSDARCCTGWRSRRSPRAAVPRCRAAARAAGRPPPLGWPTVRSGTRGSDHSTVGMWSWSRAAGVSCVSRTMNCALASGPMPPSTPSIFSSSVHDAALAAS